MLQPKDDTTALEYITGVENRADFISRSPLSPNAEEQVAEKLVHMLVSDAAPKVQLRNDLSLANGILPFQNRIVIPASLREKVLHITSESHQCVARSKVL